MTKSMLLFLLAGFCEICGGYFVWQWWRNGASIALGLLGAATLIVYGIVPTYDLAGALLCLLGVATIMYSPR